MTKLDKMRKELEAQYSNVLHAAFFEKYGARITTSFNIFSMNLISVREDGVDFTADQLAFIHGWSEGYLKAVNTVLMRDATDEYERAKRQLEREAAAA